MNMMPTTNRVIPVILCGGSGTRLWPLSRPDMPKQFQSIDDSGRTLLQHTLERVSDPIMFAPAILVTGEQHVATAREQAAAIGARLDVVIAEPCARNTAPAIAAAARVVDARRSGDVLFVTPADHLIADEASFLKAVAAATASAKSGRVVTLGIRPNEASTAYGYIRADTDLVICGAHPVSRFIEKPEADVAAWMIRDERNLWNAGMFMMRADVARAEFRSLNPVLEMTADAAVRAGETVFGTLHLDPTIYQTAESISFDYAVMEKTEAAVVLPVDMGWDDVGSWDAIWRVTPQDAHGNATVGHAVAEDCRDTLLVGGDRLVTAVGAEDTIVVETEDAVLVAKRGDSQSVRRIVDALKARNATEVERGARVSRPWGDYESLEQDDGFQVKRIRVVPGGQLSLQYHHHRCEHWVVTRGAATVTVDDKVHVYHPGESVFVPKGAVHRLENFTAEPVEIIEVQIGDYLGEDDIVRVEDVYGREERPAELAVV